MPKAHRIAAFCVLAAVAAWIATGEFSTIGSAESQPQPVPAAATPAPALRSVGVVTPVFIDHARAIRLSGVTAADKRVVLAARTDGVIATLDMTRGAMVAEGAVVMRLEGPETVAQAEIARIALDQRERELEVAERLYAGGNTPETQVTNARSARDAAAAELARAQAALDRLDLRAPFAGVVDSLEVEASEWVQTGAPVATILALDPILIRAEVSEVDLPAIAPGAPAALRLATGEARQGTVRLVAREASAQTRTFPVEIVLPNPGMALSAGMTADVVLKAAPVRAVVVPRSVITLSDKGGLGVRVLGADDVVAFAPVTILDDTPEGLVVTGIPDNVRVITSGQDLVADGETVAAVEATP
jgi:multidrug efflux system membrane fusion protein